MPYLHSRSLTVLKNVEQEQTESILIASIFSTKTWFARLVKVLVQEPMLLPYTKNSLYFHYIQNVLPTMPDVLLTH